MALPLRCLRLQWLGDLNSRYLFCHSSGGQKHKIKVSAELVSLRPPSLTYSLLSMSSPGLLCVCLSSNLLSDKNSSHTGFGSHPVTTFELCYLFKGPIFKDIHILSYWGLGLPHAKFGNTVQYVTTCKSIQMWPALGPSPIRGSSLQPAGGCPSSKTPALLSRSLWLVSLGADSEMHLEGLWSFPEGSLEQHLLKPSISSSITLWYHSDNLPDNQISNTNCMLRLKSINSGRDLSM